MQRRLRTEPERRRKARRLGRWGSHLPLRVMAPSEARLESVFPVL